MALGGGDTPTLLVTTHRGPGATRRLEARTIEPDILTAVPAAARPLHRAAERSRVPSGEAAILLLDLPLLTGTEPGYAPHVAAYE